MLSSLITDTVLLYRYQVVCVFITDKLNSLVLVHKFSLDIVIVSLLNTFWTMG